MPGSPLFREVEWKGNNILLVGSVHGAHTYYEEIVNRLEAFRPSAVLVEGNSIRGKNVEARSARAYKQIEGSTTVKPLDSLPSQLADADITEKSYENVSEEDFKRGPFDTRKFGLTATAFSRLLTMRQSEDLWRLAVEGREGEMAEKIVEQLETKGHTRVAVIFGKSHAIGVKNILTRL